MCICRIRRAQICEYTGANGGGNGVSRFGLGSLVFLSIVMVSQHTNIWAALSGVDYWLDG